ncbi:uncharacterized protein BCR38DRAFT_430851 [Pseudomassariella vexata]|uniref:Uncharacterized protein n=1 Tax=Pseudomassariella vexata TaxID=1141098 RepID=A0A1Y2E5A2_9PEZI|nr:uncharacterized protein BCR38DRAFT_430851 [Pseudomassariella vexata]ORY66617.1 hypothetical protein BCR38DRAFT_430851 [Pseudomassariella vexata]
MLNSTRSSPKAVSISSSESSSGIAARLPNCGTPKAPGPSTRQCSDDFVDTDLEVTPRFERAMSQVETPSTRSKLSAQKQRDEDLALPIKTFSEINATMTDGPSQDPAINYMLKASPALLKDPIEVSTESILVKDEKSMERARSFLKRKATPVAPKPDESRKKVKQDLRLPDYEESTVEAAKDRQSTNAEPWPQNTQGDHQSSSSSVQQETRKTKTTKKEKATELAPLSLATARVTDHKCKCKKGLDDNGSGSKEGRKRPNLKISPHEPSTESVHPASAATATPEKAIPSLGVQRYCLHMTHVARPTSAATATANEAVSSLGNLGSQGMSKADKKKQKKQRRKERRASKQGRVSELSSLFPSSSPVPSSPVPERKNGRT